jgi:protein required for attachment to host cells
MTTWILICNSSRARLYASEPLRSHLEPVEAFAHPESRAKDVELRSDSPGRTRTSLRTYSPAGIAPHTEPRVVEMQKFARVLADALDEGWSRDAYRSLIVCAPPAFLGHLRGVLTERVSRAIVREVVKDWTALAPDDLRAALAAVIDGDRRAAAP